MSEKKLHILFVASWYPNRNQPVLGNFIQRHAQAVAALHNVSVVAAFSSANHSCIDEHHDGNLSEFVAHYPKLKDGDLVLSKVRKVKAYRKAMRELIQRSIKKHGAPDVIHVHVAWPAALVVLPMAKELGKPIVLTEHWSGYLPEDGNYTGFFLKHYTRALVQKSKAVTVVSERMKAAMHQHGLDAEFHHLPNVADTGVFAHSHREAKNEPFRFLHVSMLVDREKNITGMLKAFAEAGKQAAFQLTIVGDGPEKKLHERTARELGISEHVAFAGLKSPEEIAQLMNEHDALLMFSNFEGMPVTIIEAQCCGMPVLATNTGAIREMLTNPKDIMVNPGEIENLGKAMLLMRRSLQEEDIDALRKSISERAQQRYSYGAVADQLNSIYKKVISAR
jgi:glycosyltransferase involved in cell wall biosynthesis